MLLIPCPVCGKRPEAEFTYAGEAHVARPADPSALDEAGWADFLHHRANPRGEHAERWRHTHGCGRFFNALRDTVTDRFIASYPSGHARPGANTAASTASLDAPEMRTDTESFGPG